MIALIRISGLVEMPEKARITLDRIRLRRKYSLVLMEPTKENMSLIQKVRNFIAYGAIDNNTLKELLEKRGQSLSGKKIDAEKIISQIGKKSLTELGLKPFFRLHPPRGGIDSKVHFPIRKGVLGDNKEKINDLIRRML
ncbi:50S ribosomal protein L30 [Candidatus Pacearchaeota archaeon CG10_big_fil_rev_8_21_14_0_10_31_24]|nr:MAG: 50S ribosomal protein L30 [Candidatus Pacearchaeota archaeon CG10_big_fil_rev_8_21_14_0_10_31_24]